MFFPGISGKRRPGGLHQTAVGPNLRAWRASACVHCMKMNGCNGSISIPSPPGALNPCRLGVWSDYPSVLHSTPTRVAMGTKALAAAGYGRGALVLVSVGARPDWYALAFSFLCRFVMHRIVSAIASEKVTQNGMQLES